MIPMMTPRKSNDDDRPMGLKFTRTNFFNFSSKRAAEESSSSGSTTLRRNPSTSQQPPMMMPIHHHSNNTKRDSDMSSNTSLSPTPILSPTLPARSPFRIRDSLQQQQQQQEQQASTNKIISSHDNTLAAAGRNKSSSSIDDPPSIYSSISSSSSTNSTSSSSAATADDELLVQELESMWKLKSPGTKKDSVQQEQLKLDINSDDMLLQLLISHAVIDAREFKVLTFEEFETLKQHHARLKSRVKNSVQKLELDKKIQETSHSLSNLSSNKNRESVMLLLDEAVEADRKVKILSQRLDELKSEEIETQYQVLQHTAGVLCLGLQNLENNNSVKSPLTPIATPTSPGDDQQQSDRLKQKVHALKSELGTMTNTLINMLKRYDLNFNNEQPLTATDLLDQLENQLKAYKSESKKFESQLSAAEERYRIESMSEKKLEIQLRAAQSKNQAAEQKYNNLQKEMDDLLEQMKKPSHEDWLPQDDFDFADDSNTKMEELETELATAKENQQRVDRELEMGYKQVAQLKATVSEMELASSKIQSQVAVFQSREDALKSEMEQYRTQVFDLRTDKEKWERTMKRRTIMQVMDGTTSSTAIQEKYEQQLEEQEQEYQAQLKEQAAFLDKTTRQCEQLNQEHAKLSATCQDLELLIRDKTRALDARDVQVSQLEAQLQQQQQQQMANTAKQQQQQRAGTPLQHEELIQLQQQFSAKESAWIESSTAMEANFEGILKEFDRLTGTAMEFETDRRNYERRIENLSSELSELEASLLEEKTKNMGYEKDTPTTASLRKEFRKMINDMKADHQRALEREGEEKKKLEKQLKDLKHEREMSRYERMTKGVQTLLMP